ncbi:hypothetical protein P3G55_03220 [Leptospira sp. 96542]|nr:hypothetical protein [Leptospira sp. 96542]
MFWIVSFICIQKKENTITPRFQIKDLRGFFILFSEPTKLEPKPIFFSYLLEKNMSTKPKLYQILEKAHIDAKIGVEIQDWIVDTISEKRDQGMNFFQETKILPIQQDLKMGFDSMRVEMDQKFESMQSIMDQKFESMQSIMDQKFESMQSIMNQRFESMQAVMDQRFESMQAVMDQRFESMQAVMDARFLSLEKRLDATNFSIRILGVPIVGATIGGLGVVFLQIYERLFG